MDQEFEEIEDQPFKGLMRWDFAPTLASIAKTHFESFNTCNMRATELKDSPDHVRQYCPDCRVCFQIRQLSVEALQHGIVTVTFAAFALEGHINEYGSRRLTATYFKRFIDKLDTVSKWMIIPRLVCGKEINRDCQPFQSLVELFGLRNKIVHPKARDVDFDELTGDRVPVRLREQDELLVFVPRAVQALELLADEARRLDPNDPLFGKFLR